MGYVSSHLNLRMQSLLLDLQKRINEANVRLKSIYGRTNRVTNALDGKQPLHEHLTPSSSLTARTDAKRLKIAE
jgi:hypothetical protein